MRRLPILVASVLGVAAVSLATPSRACAPAPPEGVFVAIAQEAAVVVWDDASGTEHFVRRASFRTQARDFGFLVPTPTKPELAAEDDAIFDRLEQMIVPEIRYEPEWRGVDPTPLVLGAFLLRAQRSVPAGAIATAPVRVLEEKRVAGYDAVVLEADDPGALAEWLARNGYAKRPALTEWLEPYVAARWKLTAFKIAGSEVDGGDPSLEPPRHVGAEAVRMSFHTARPFFPYREPRDQRESVPASMSSARALRVFFVGKGRAVPKIGDGSTAFQGKTSWAAPLDVARAALPVPTPPGAWLTALEDDAAPRPGVDELWLDVTEASDVVKPPPVVVRDPRPVPLPLDVLTVVSLAGFFGVRRARRRRGR